MEKTHPATDWLQSAMSAATAQGVDPQVPGDQTVAAAAGGLETHAVGTPPPTVQTLTIGDDDLGHDLVLGDPLGRGGMAIVHSARQTSLDREVAVKRVRPDLARPQAPRELATEARLTGALEHPNVIPVHLLGQGADGRPAMVMKRVEGVSWHHLLRNQDHGTWAAWPGDRLARNIGILIGVCRAVEYAHSRGIGHLDIKPGNVMVGSYGEIYLMDWGLAVRFDRLDDLPEKEFAGTPGFMPPELLLGRRKATRGTDIYLLGSTLHYVLTGEVRHPGSTLEHKLNNVLASEPVEYEPGIPQELGAIANIACAGHAADRYQTAGEVRLALEKYLSHRGSVQLADVAEQHLDELTGLPVSPSRWGPVAAQDRELRLTLATQARFGFEQALHTWPENRRAREGLQTALEWMIQFELDRENVEAAAALMNALPKKSTRLMEDLARLRLKLRDQGDVASRLRKLEENQIFRGEDPRRSLMLAVNGIFWAVVALLWGHSTTLGLLRNTPTESLLISLAGTASVVLVILRARRLMLDNSIRRRFTLAFAGYCLLFNINHVVGVVRDLPLADVGLMDLTLLAGFVGTGAALVHRQLFWAAGVAAVALVGVAAYPEAIFEWAAVAVLGVNLVFAWVTRPVDGWRRDR